ncbi:MAG: hypothetical protein HFF39_02415 [Lawsonibacter sp.]|nr:hypothetical protein [Lawsonibacter sp.]
MKRSFSFIMVLALLMGIIMLPGHALESEIFRETETIFVEGIGYLEIETVITRAPVFTRSGVGYDKSISVRNSGRIIATVTLDASFGYDGSRAWVNSASATHSTNSGWSYGGESISKSGGTVTLTATLSKPLYNDIPVSISITCSPSGVIS